MIAGLAILAAGFLLAIASPASGATLEPVGSFDRPISLTSDPADPDRLLIGEREGTIFDAKAEEVIADIGDLVTCCSGERGLLSFVLAPDFATSARFYAAYTGAASAGGAVGDIHVDAFVLGDEAGEPPLRQPILSIEHSTRTTHNGGQLQFGPDGHLYIAVGDGGGIGDPDENGQDLESRLGKVLRIAPRPGEVPPYEIPVGNPFVSAAGLDEIWSYGLRNPWRFSFDRETGDMVIADVGQGEREEVDFAEAPIAGSVGGGGENYGWNCREGLIAYPGAPDACDGLGGFTDPVFDYPHSDPGGGAAFGCAITGGYVVRDPTLTDLLGRYVYADYCEGEIRSLLLPQDSSGIAMDDRSEGLEVPSPVSFGEDSSGRVYVIANDGEVFRLASEPRPDPEQPGSGDGQPGSGDGDGGGGAPPGIEEPRRVRLRIAATPRPPGRGVRIAVRTTPCAESAERRVRLIRGGERFGSKRLDAGCAARFQVAIAARSTFVAELLDEGGKAEVRSRRLIIQPSAGPPARR